MSVAALFGDRTMFPFWEPAQSTQKFGQVYPAIAPSTSSPLSQLILFRRIAPGWELVQRLVLELTQEEDGSYLLSDNEFYLYGQGETLAAAQDDYVAALLEYYALLADKPDPPTQAVFRRLQLFLRPTSL